MMVSNKIGRNDPCLCGSGKKYKKCCLNRNKNVIESPKQIRPKIISPQEIKLQLIPSYIVNGHRYRTIYNRVYERPLKETFHEFLVNVVQRTFGEHWWKKQVGMSNDRRHVVMRWCENLKELQIRNSTDENKLYNEQVYEADASGPAWALITLGYDLYCLKCKNKLPEHIVKRLRKNISFPSVRYEILVAALMLRYGFDIEFLDESEIDVKHCEFIAKDKKTGVRIGIEAKSRKRTEHKEIYDSDRDSKALYRLISTAIKQQPEEIPYIIFVDVNTPLTPGIDIEKKPWFLDIIRAIGKMDIPTHQKPDLYSAIVVTNFAFHHEDPNTATAPPEFGLVVPQYSKHPLPNLEWINDLWNNVKQYASVPSEV